ncbi:MAG TPA: YdbH domain-containing protein [Methylococcaceae bacterium]|nr:YdbH domain-containing protein [Methylococcaceae bacterium]
MVRRSSLIIGFGSIFVLLVAIYAASPVVIAGFLGYRLAAYGFREVNVSCGYPRRDKLRVDALKLGRRVGDGSYALQATGVIVRYRLSELIAGRFAGIRIPQVVIDRKPAQDLAASEPVTMPLAALLSGEWLAQLPTEDLVLDELNLRWQEPTGEVYELRAGGRIKAHRLFLNGRLRPRGNDALSLEFSAEASDAGELELAVHTPAQPIAHVTNRLHVTAEGDLTVAGAMLVQLEGIAPLLGKWFGPGDFVSGMQGKLQSSWQGIAPADAGLAKMELNSEHRLELKAARLGEAIDTVDVRLQASARLQQGVIDWRLEDKSQLIGRVNLAPPNSAERGELPMTIDLPRGISGRIEPSTETLTLRLERGGCIRVNPWRWGELLVPESRIDLADAATLSYRSASGQWSWGPVSIALESSPWRWRDNELANQGAMLKIDDFGGTGENWHGEGGMQIKAIKPAIGKRLLPQGELSARFRLGPKQLGGEGTLATSNGKLVLRVQGLHVPMSGSGSLQFDLNPVEFGTPGQRLSELLEPWPYPIDLTSGRLSATGRAVWRSKATSAPPMEDEITLKLEDIAGQYRKIGFSGLSAKLALADHGALRTTETARLQIGSLDIGMPVTQLSATAEIAPHPKTHLPVIRTDGLSADLLGGKAHTKPFEWDFSAARNHIAIELERLALSEIIAIVKPAGLEGDGHLDGRLPIEITSGGSVLRGGELHARPPGGSIRYRPAGNIQSLARDNPRGFVLQALSNLRYRSLTVKADSTPAGDLSLRVELRGSNPDWQSGRPVHLNVNLQENIPMLLRSLRFADELSESVGKRAQERLQNDH